jgi:hypothetical protein
MIDRCQDDFLACEHFLARPNMIIDPHAKIA